MRTEIVADNEMPAMTADHMRRAIVAAYGAYETDNRATQEKWIAPDFSFTSPYDDGIYRETYFQRCWPNHETTAKMTVERIFIDGNAAYVTYLCLSVDGRSFRNTEYLTFRGGKIASVEVYFGAEYRDGRFVEAVRRHSNRVEDASGPAPAAPSH